MNTAQIMAANYLRLKIEGLNRPGDFKRYGTPPRRSKHARSTYIAEAGRYLRGRSVQPVPLPTGARAKKFLNRVRRIRLAIMRTEP